MRLCEDNMVIDEVMEDDFTIGSVHWGIGREDLPIDNEEAFDILVCVLDKSVPLPANDGNSSMENEFNQGFVYSMALQAEQKKG